MKYKSVTLRLSRTIRLKAYVVEQPEAELIAHLEPGDKLEEVYAEVKDDLYFILDEMEVDIRAKFKADKERIKNAIKEQHK